jgi:hypothetical protein
LTLKAAVGLGRQLTVQASTPMITAVEARLL